MKMAISMRVTSGMGLFMEKVTRSLKRSNCMKVNGAMTTSKVKGLCS